MSHGMDVQPLALHPDLLSHPMVSGQRNVMLGVP